MKGRERALRALNFLPVDQVALMGGEIESGETLSKLAGCDYWKAVDQREVAIQAFRNLEIDLLIHLLLPYSYDMEVRSWDVETMFRYAKQRYPNVEAVVKKINTFPTPEQVRKTYDQQAAYRIYLNDAIEHDRMTGDDMLWLAGGFKAGVCKFMWYLDFGYPNYFILMVDYKETAHQLYLYSAECGRLQNEAIAAAIRENDLPPFIYVGEDLCYNNGLFVSPKLLDQIYFPGLAYALEPLVRAGIDIIWHCDGNVTPIVDRLLAMGITGFQGFQEDINVHLDWIVKKRTRHGRRPIILGSVQARSVLPLGSVVDVLRDVERCINTVGRESGFFLGPSAVIQPEVPIENIRALYQHGKAYGQISVKPWGIT
ncbi:MAG: hypothetical protein MUO64_22480 [Anaerolineales bacterium]|nr:hypothetical protein [Anaerolineales bacterium]